MRTSNEERKTSEDKCYQQEHVWGARGMRDMARDTAHLRCLQACMSSIQCVPSKLSCS